MSTMELLMEMAGYGLSLLWLMVLILGGGFACVAVLGLLASADQWRLPKRSPPLGTIDPRPKQLEGSGLKLTSSSSIS